MCKLSKAEEMLISVTNENLYNLYWCSNHGVYSIRKDSISKVCPHCGKYGSRYTKGKGVVLDE